VVTRRGTTFGRRTQVAILGACLAAAVSLFTVASAAAQQFVPHVFEKTFNGSESPGGPFGGSVQSVAVDKQSGDVYVLTTQSGLKIYKFNAQGEPSPFTDPSLEGSSVITLGATNVFSEEVIKVDNSGGPHQGRIYAENEFIDEHVWAFEPSGAPVGGNFPLGFGSNDLAVSPVNGNFFLTGVPLSQRAYEFNPEGVKTGNVIDMSQHGFTYKLEAGPEGDLFTFNFQTGIQKYNPASELVDSFPALETSSTFGVDPVSGDVLSAGYEEAHHYNSNGDELPPIVYELEGEAKSVAINGVTHDIYVAHGNRVEIFKAQAPVTLPDAHTEAPSEIEATSVTLNGIVNPDGIETAECAFEYGTSVFFGGQIQYEESVPCDQGQVISGSSDTAVSATLTGLTQGATYHYRLTVGNANGPFRTRDHTVIPSAKPLVENAYIDEVHSDSVAFHAEITPEGAPTTWHVLYGTADCVSEPEECTETPESSSIGAGRTPLSVNNTVTGLQQGTTYHYVVVATNQSGSTESAGQIFTTFPYTPVLEDHCANAHVRQQTGAALLADCRAYELVSADNAGGYNVESYLTEGQMPFGGYPDAINRVLYGVHDGAIPGSGNPTNHGLDPYVATRGSDGWSTAYVGIPANLPYSAESFASPLSAADASLDTFAFGGEGLCSPCFSDGTTGVPVRLADGELVQGMKGSLQPGAGATAGMLVKKPLSANGGDLIFGSTSEFESEAGSPAIYDRNLSTGVTHAVSKLPDGNPIPCLMNCSSDGLAELDVSADGSRIVIGQLISTDSAGNRYWHLYMDIGDSGTSIDLTPGATDGALYAGMTADGSKVYFTTTDKLSGQDGDTGQADLYRADVTPAGASRSVVSVGSGGSGNSESCEPLANSRNEHWNTPGTTANCDVVAVGGGGGVAAGDGSVYFLSPELLDGTSEPQDGVHNAPNLYLARPGSSPQFVATLESSATGPSPALEEHKFKGFFGQSPFPRYVAVDNSGGPSDGDVYVADNNEQVIRKYDSEGNLVTGWQEGGEFEPALAKPFAGIGVGPGGTLYVAIHQELNSASDLFEYDEEGEPIGSTNLEGAPQQIGIAVSATTGRVFYEGYYQEIYGYKKGVGVKQIGGGEAPPKGLAVDPNAETLYVNFGGNEIGRYDFNPADPEERSLNPDGSPCKPKGIFNGCEPTSYLGAGEVFNANGMYVDPTREELYVDEGNKILRFEPDNRRGSGPDVGAKVLSNSTSVAVSTSGDLYATNSGSEGANVAAFGPLVLAPDPRTDSPMVIDSVNDAGSRHTGDFQITPNGNDAVFTSTISLTGYTNFSHGEVFRYDALGEGLDCVSCNPTGAKATGEAALAANGLSLTDDGSTVFFDSADPLVPSDLDNREDVYEWKNGKTSLISTGLSPYNSIILSGSADGTDAFFFTRDTLVPQDLNGSLAKVYDARADGGFVYTPPPVSCKASDECHGASSPVPPPPAVNTITGSGGNHMPAKSTKCRHGKVKRHGHCVKPHRKHHHRKHHRRGQSRGGQR
jgi:hypothetical protein